MRSVIVTLVATVGCSQVVPAAPDAALPLPAVHASAAALTGVWERFDETGVSDRWEFTAAGTFHVWTNWPRSYFGDFRDVTGTYTATDTEIQLTGTTGEGWPFTYDETYYADEATFVRSPFQLAEVTDGIAIWRGADHLRFGPPGSEPLVFDLAPVLSIAADGAAELTWLDPTCHYDEAESGTAIRTGDALAIDFFDDPAALTFLDARTLRETNDRTWVKGIDTFSHPLLFGLVYHRIGLGIPE